MVLGWSKDPCQELWLRRPWIDVSKSQLHVCTHTNISICINVYTYIIYHIDNIRHLKRQPQSPSISHSPRLSPRVSGHFMPGISCGDWNPGAVPNAKNAKCECYVWRNLDGIILCVCLCIYVIYIYIYNVYVHTHETYVCTYIIYIYIYIYM